MADSCCVNCGDPVSGTTYCRNCGAFLGTAGAAPGAPDPVVAAPPDATVFRTGPLPPSPSPSPPPPPSPPFLPPPPASRRARTTTAIWMAAVVVTVLLGAVTFTAVRLTLEPTVVMPPASPSATTGAPVSPSQFAATAPSLPSSPASPLPPAPPPPVTVTATATATVTAPQMAPPPPPQPLPQPQPLPLQAQDSSRADLACDAGYIVVLASALGIADFQRQFDSLRPTFPDAHYLYTGNSCLNFRSQDAYALYAGPYRTLGDACLARFAGTPDGYVKVAGAGVGPRSFGCGCVDRALGWPTLSRTAPDAVGSGPYVAEAQQALARLGYWDSAGRAATIDGDFEAAVIAFKSDEGLGGSVDVDSATWSAIIARDC